MATMVAKRNAFFAYEVIRLMVGVFFDVVI